MTTIPSAAPTEAAAWWHRYASLRIKTLSLIAATVLGLLLLLYIPLRRELGASFGELEAETMRANVARAVSALNDELASLNGTAGDYATWDDTYQFAADGNQEYVAVNVADNALANSRISLFLVYDAERRLVLGKGVNLATGQPRDVPAVFGQAPPERLFALPATTSAVTGLLVLDSEAFLLAARPIITSDGEGPSRGTLVMGREVSDGLIQRLAGTTYLAVALLRADDPAVPGELREAIRSGAAPVIQPLDGRRIAGYQGLADLGGATGLVARVEIEREIYARGQASIRSLTLAMLLGGLVLGLAMMLLIERTVLWRLVQLDGAVGLIRAEQSLAARVPVRGHDELAGLSRSINLLLDGVEQARQHQLDAETARQELQ
ncbi:MAG TPA: CHASE4 domain-containing protein, partial [Herpetosiphonaceae bacterium]